MNKANKNYFIYIFLFGLFTLPMIVSANPIADVMQEKAEIPTYFRYAYSFPFNTALCSYYGDNSCIDKDFNYNDYVTMMKNYYIPIGFRGHVRNLDTAQFRDNLAWLKASEELGFVSFREYPPWGYRGIRDIRVPSGGEVNLYETNPETMSYHITGYPLNRSNVDFIDEAMPYYQQQYDYLISAYNTKTIVGLARDPTSDYPIYTGVVPAGPPRLLGGYNNLSICKFAASPNFPANSINSSGDLIISPSGWRASDAFSLYSGTYTVTINFKNTVGNLIPNTIVGVYPTKAGSMDYNKIRASSGVLTLNNVGETIYIDAVADLGNYNFYYYQGSFEITQNTNLDIVLSQPYGKSKIWQQCITKTNTFNVADIAKEVQFFFGREYHSVYFPEATVRLEKAIYDYAVSKMGQPITLLTASDARYLPSDLGYRNIPQFTYCNVPWRDVVARDDPSWVAHDFYCAENRWFTPEEVFQKQLYMYPAFPVQPMYGAFDFNDVFKKDIYENTFKPFGQILNRMRYVGSFYGRENPKLNVLAVGGNNLLLWQLSSAINYTFANQGSGFINTADLSKFDTILWQAGAPSLEELASIKNYLANGGGIVWAQVMGDGESRWLTSWNNTWSEIFGFRAENVGYGNSPTNLSIVNPGHPVLEPYGNTILSGGYYPLSESCCDARARFVQLTDVNPTVILNSGNLGPRIWENNYSNGRVVFLPSPVRLWQYRFEQNSTGLQVSSIPSSGYLTLVLNSLFYSAKKESALPIIWYDTYQNAQTWSNKVQHSGITGKVDSPKLLWLYNVTANPENFNLHLSADFFNIPTSGWVVLDANSMKIINRGTGNDIYINLEVPANTWTPIYISSIQPDGFIYSNVFYDGKSSGKFISRGPYYPMTWFLVDSPEKPTRINANSLNISSLDILRTLTEKTSLSELFIDEGWYYDTQNKILYVAYKTPDAPSPPTPLPSSKLYSIIMVSPGILSETSIPDMAVSKTLTLSGNSPHAIINDGTYLYVGYLDMKNPGKVSRIRLSDLTEVDSITFTERGVTYMHILDNYLYVSTASPSSLLKINLNTRIVESRLGFGVSSLFYYGGYLYAGGGDVVKNTDCCVSLIRIDPTTFTEVGRLEVNMTISREIMEINGLLYFQGHNKWSYAQARLAVIDPATFSVVKYIDFPASSGSLQADRLAFDGEWLYMNNDGVGTITRFNPQTEEIKTTVINCRRPFDVDVKDDYIYAACYDNGNIEQVYRPTKEWVKSLTVDANNQKLVQQVAEGDLSRAQKSR